MEQDDNTYRILQLSSGKDAIFAPNDICAIAVIDGYILSKDKAVEMLRIANNHNALVGALENLLADVLNIGSSSITMRPSVNEACDLIEKLMEQQP